MEQHGALGALVGGSAGLLARVEAVERLGALGCISGFCIGCSRVSMLASPPGLGSVERAEHYARLVTLCEAWYGPAADPASLAS